jgi:hypothetical protein
MSTGPEFGQFQTSVLSPLPLPTVTYPLSGDSNANFVESLYVSLLGRLADPASLSVLTEQLDAGATRAAIATGIWNSPEHFGYEVNGFYANFLHRVSDPEGRGYWIGLLQQGVGEQAVVDGFLASAEYQHVNAGASAMAAALYNDVLSRPADPPGLAAWQTWLQTYSPVVAAFDFVRSAESYQRAVDAYFSAFLRRATDDSGATLVSELQAGTATIESVAIGFLASNEYFSDATVNAGH